MPATVAAADLLVILFGSKDAGLVSLTGWTELLDFAGSGPTTAAYAKIADGSEGGTTVDVVTQAAARAMAHVYRIPGGALPESATAGPSNQQSPVPPPLSPSWGAADTLWIVAACRYAAEAVNAPTNYTLGSNGTVTGMSLSSAWRQNNTATETPGAMAGTTSFSSARITLAVILGPVEGGATAEVEVAAAGAGVGSEREGGATAEVEADGLGAGTAIYPPTPSWIPSIGWRGRIALVVEVGQRGAAVGESVWDTSDWAEPSTVDPATWSGLEPVWVPLDGCNVSELTTRRGRLFGTDRFSTGTATATLEWELEDGAWSFRASAPIKLGDELRFSASVDGGAPVPIWRGHIKTYKDVWTPGIHRLTARVAMVDRFADLAAVIAPALGSPVGAGETTGARLERILAAAELPAAYSSIATGEATVAATILERNLLDEANATAEAEPGQLYVDRSAVIVFRDRNWRSELWRSSSTMLVWSSAGDVDTFPPHTCINDLSTELNTDLVANQVTRAKTGGTPYTVRDETAILLYGLRTNQRLDMVNDTQADVEFAADLYLAQRSQRVHQVGPLRAVVNPYSPGRVIQGLIDIELLDRHRLDWDDGSGQALYTELVHVQSIAHTIGPLTWTVECGVWAYRDLEV
jgi:hypothetical protein